MKHIVLARIDDRLIHGQVVTGWLKSTNGNVIYIVDDTLKDNAFMITVLKTAKPTGTRLEIFTVDEAAIELQKPQEPDERVFILAKTPQVFERLLESGVVLPAVILGGIGIASGRKKFYQNVAASDEELQSMRRILAKGTEIIYQLVPDTPSKNISSLLK